MATKLIRSTYNLSAINQGCVLSIGNFDGVHRGHQKLIEHVIAKAKALQAPSMIITFEPHPFEFFHRENLKIPRITRLREKFYALKGLHVDNVLILTFNQSLAQMSARDFVTDILFEQLHPIHIVLGDDFHFGHKRQGDFALIKALGEELGFSVEAMPTICAQHERISSTWVRKALLEGDLELAKNLLGRPYSMLGRVRGGDQLGRVMGFPTANIFLHRKLTPINGVFTVLMHGVSPHPEPGVANVGTRPTVGGTRTILEVHLLNFNKDIYGKYVEVEFCKKIRDEVRYPNLELLKEQIAKDVEYAQNYFKK